ncbi:G-protein coupled receptor Mth2-like isoform X2 [Prorops nasuta]|uniref:G-protein coupled receptor Mth2-like isoform X2 n=1 Tax=Prorops nasuta TaxID=863751 RepID=UPI0034CD6C11
MVPAAKLPGLSDELDKEEYIISEDNACLEMLTESEAETKLVIRTCGGPELCSKKACVRKCCPEDEAFMRNCQKFEAPTTALEFHQAVSDLWNYSESGFKDYGILVGSPCKYGMYPVLPEEKWNVTSNGHIYVPGYKVFEHHEYCMDIIYNRSHMEEALYPFVCFDSPTIDEYTETRFRVNAALELTSCTFLLLTLLVYACLPTLQNLHGKTLMCHVSSLLVAYTCLSIIIFATPEDSDKRHDYTSTPLCQFLGYTMLFSFLSTFSWLNVMCFDIWWTFGNLRGRNMRGRRERKKFFFYCLYSWGLAFFICIIGFVADFTEGLPFYLLPHIGEDRCWFATESAHKNAKTFFYGEVVFFIAPVTLQLISNIVFFVLTSIHCTKVKAEIRRVVDPSDPRSKRFHADRIKFIMNVKLFIVMGISWIMEVISFFLNKYAKDLEWRNEYFYVTDVMNCLQGLLIFILFVVKSRVYSSLRRRLGLSEKKRTVASNATATVQDPYKVKKSSSSSTLMSTFANSMVP